MRKLDAVHFFDVMTGFLRILAFFEKNENKIPKKEVSKQEGLLAKNK